MPKNKLARIVLDVVDHGGGDVRVHHDVKWSKELNSMIDTMDQGEKRLAADHRTQMMKSAVNMTMVVKSPGEQHESVSEREIPKNAN